jgi:hypothetical protein
MKRRIGLYEKRVKTGEWMLWLNPSDNQGVRFLIEHVRDGREYPGSG